jgi:RNA polymerase sigma factor (sigma-70 family)
MNLELEDRPSPADPKDAPEPMNLACMVAAAIGGHQGAWRELYRRYDPLVITTAARFRLPQASIEDVSQTVWGLLVTHLARIREPRALPGWIVTTTRNEAYRLLRVDVRCAPSDPSTDPRLQGVDHVEPGADIYRAELRQELDQLIDVLSADHRRLMRMLLADPQPSYAEISRTLSIPLGSIGPTRSRCLARMRAHSRQRGEAFALAA